MIRLILDSTCDFTSEFAKEHNLKIVPLSVIFENEVYQENIDLTKEEFYRKMAASSVLPKTSQPSPSLFADAYENSDGDELIVLTISSGLSGTYQSANLAAQMVSDKKIEVIDSKNVTLGIQVQALQIIKMIDAGLCFDEIVTKARENAEKVRLVAAINTLENLIKGGRLSKAEGVIGSLISIKPVITINQEGKIETLHKSRGMKRALTIVSETALSDDVDQSKAQCCGFTSDDENLNKFLSQFDDSRFHFDLKTSIGAVIGTHAGSNACAIAYFVK